VPVVLYQRGAARLTEQTAAEAAALPNVVGIKDGVGDREEMARIVQSVRALPGGEDFLLFNGLPTAEVSMPDYRRIGVELYSSAAFAFVPEVSTAYHRALAQGDETLVSTLLTEFFEPLVALRDETPGFAVSLVKAGVTPRGLNVGGVRAPLLDPEPAQLARLAELIDKGLQVVEA
jgi:5-dehydro-4-deoxyglucarate dehydratase